MRLPNAVLTLLAMTLATVSATAGPLPVPTPPAGPLSTGDRVVTIVPPLPSGVVEFELVLVPDTGPAIQVGRELPAGTREIRWRMPAVAARRARLVLRAGREHAEECSAASAPFELAGLPEHEWQRVIQGRSEAGYVLQVGAGEGGTGVVPAPDESEIVLARTMVCEGEDAAFPVAAFRATSTPLDAPRSSPIAAAPAPAPHVRLPGFIPLRN